MTTTHASLSAWPESHQETLRKLIPTHTFRQIGDALGKSETAVRQKAYQLGLCRNGEKQKTRWPEAHIDALLQMVTTHTFGDIGNALGKSESAVKKKAYQFGLYRNIAKQEERA